MGKSDYIVELSKRITDYLGLILDEEKKVTVTNIISRYSSELNEKIAKCIGDDEQTTKFFKNYINRVLSIVESLSFPPIQYKSARKTIQNEVYSCLEVFLLIQKKESVKREK